MATSRYLRNRFQKSELDMPFPPSGQDCGTRDGTVTLQPSRAHMAQMTDPVVPLSRAKQDSKKYR